MPNALVYGDSVSDAQVDPNVYGGGRWFTGLCNELGWTQVGAGTSSTDVTRSAIAGSSLQNIVANPVTQHGVDGTTSRLGTYHPDILFVEYGANDFFYADDLVGPTSFAAAWDTTLQAIASLTPAPTQFYMVGMTNMAAQGQQPIRKPPFQWAQDFAGVWKGLEDVTRQKADQYGYIYIDMSNMPLYYLGIPYGWDGVHPKSQFARGYYTTQALAAVRTPHYWCCGGHG